MDENYELLSAEAGDLVGGAQGLGQGHSDGLNHRIAGRMPIGVIDLLEEIDVEDQDGERSLVAPVETERILGEEAEAPAVEETGEGIRLGQVTQSRHVLRMLRRGRDHLLLGSARPAQKRAQSR